MLAVTVFQSISAVFFTLFALLLMGVILLQRGRGVGLAGAFGGGGAATAFGAKTGDFLTWVTIVMFAIYVLLAVILNFIFTPAVSRLVAPVEPETTPAAQTETAPPAPAAESQPAETMTPAPASTSATPPAATTTESATPVSTTPESAASESAAPAVAPPPAASETPASAPATAEPAAAPSEPPASSPATPKG